MKRELIFGDGKGGGSSQMALENILAEKILRDDWDLITHYRGVRNGVVYEFGNTSEAGLGGVFN